MGRFLLSQIGWPTHGATVAVTLAFVYGMLPPQGYFVVLFITFWLGVVVTVWWLLRGLSRLTALYRYGGRNASGRSWWRWVVLPACVGLVLCLGITRLPEKAAFAISRPSMERLAQDVIAGKTALPVDRFCGVYQVRINAADVHPDGVTLWLPGAGFLSGGGFFCRTAPAVPTTRPTQTFFQPYAGQWETVSENFMD